MNIAILKKEKLEGHPSLMEAFSANLEAIEELKAESEKLELELLETKEKIQIADDLGMGNQGLKSKKTRLQNIINRIPLQIKAYSKGYLEMPDFGRGESLDNEKYYGITLNANVPLRVFKAVQRAKGEGIFEELVIYRPPAQYGRNKRDPIISGKIGDRTFFITSYR